MRQVVKAGVTGGVGSGKSTVAKMLEAFGAPVYYADDAAKRLMRDSAALRAGLEEAFGPKTFDADGRLDRAYLAEQAFGDPKKLVRLNALVHPAVQRDFKEWIDARVREGKTLVFKEAAITLETGTDAALDYLALVYAPLRLRLERVAARDEGATEASVRARARKQYSDFYKTRRVNFVLYNDGAHMLAPQVVDLLKAIQAKFPGTRLSSPKSVEREIGDGESAQN